MRSQLSHRLPNRRTNDSHYDWTKKWEAGRWQPVDDVVAGRTVGEDLEEEDAQGDPGNVDPLPPPIVGVAFT